MTIEQVLPINQILTGDCAEILKTFPSNSFDAVVTDPPFGIGFVYHGNEEVADNPTDYWVFLKPIYEECMRVLKPGGFLAIWQAQLNFKHFWE